MRVVSPAHIANQEAHGMAQSDEHTGLVQRDLDDDEVAQRAAKLASEEIDREALREKKVTHNREWNEQLKQANVRIAVLASEVDTHKAWVAAQAPLFGELEADDEPEATVPARRGRGRRGRAANDGASA
jgi:hypothetical protein